MRRGTGPNVRAADRRRCFGPVAGAALLVGLALIAACSPARAQLPGVGAGLRSQPLQKNQPVTFTADQVKYDRDGNIVTATGHVEAWQNDHVIRADKVTYDRSTNVVAASGHVVLLEPDGEVLFSDYAELTQGMRDAVLNGMRAILAQNAKLAANGARRTEGQLNELSRVLYSPCNLCKNNPSAPPEWQIRAYSAVQDLEHKRIEFEDAVLEMYGVPVAYSPYFSVSDPSVKRQSGFMIPTAGNNTFLGAFFALPYYYVIDKTSDVTITPTVDTGTGPQLEAIYRQKFNNGTMRIDVAGAYDEKAFQGLLFAKGQFAYNDEWRYGFDVNEATSANYLRDFRLQGYGQDVLSSTIYAEGFGQGSFSRLDTHFYQGLISSVDNRQLPYVLPRYQYSYFGQPDELGGRLAFDGGGFNILRAAGTNTQRLNGSINYELPELGRFGDAWDFIVHVDSAAYNATDLTQAPNFSPVAAAASDQAMPTAAIRLNWPFMRAGGDAGSQLIEPIAQLVVAPNKGVSSYVRVPNEDSLDLFFSDANLFALNRYPGIDRLEGGVRAMVALHSAWYAGSTMFDGFIGQSYRTQTAEGLFPQGSGLGGTTSDIVARAYFAPTDWLDLTYRTRLDHDNLDTRFVDAVAGLGPSTFKVTMGYLYSATDPYYALDTPPGQIPTESFFIPRNEVSMGLATKYGHWKFSGYARRDIEHSDMVAIGANGGYEDECLIVALNFFRLFTNYNGVSNVTGLTVNLTFKTLGTFGFPAM